MIIIRSWEEELKQTGKTIFYGVEIFYCQTLKSYFRKRDGCEIAETIEELRESEEYILNFLQERMVRWENGYVSFSNKTTSFSTLYFQCFFN